MGRREEGKEWRRGRREDERGRGEEGEEEGEEGKMVYVRLEIHDTSTAVSILWITGHAVLGHTSQHAHTCTHV